MFFMFIKERGNEQTGQNYRPVSLLPVGGNIFERLTYNSLSEFFIKKDLISSHQSAFQPGDSSINQLLSVTHEIYKSSDDGFEIRVVFVDTSQAFDKIYDNAQ